MNGGVFENVIGGVNEGAEVSGAINWLWKVRSLGLSIKIMAYERVCRLCSMGERQGLQRKGERRDWI